MADNSVGAEVHERWLDFDFGSVRTLDSGIGRPVLYLHGTGDSGAMLPLLTELAQRHMVIRPDHPGFLHSADGPFENPGQLARWYVELLDRLGVEELDIIGCSFGGWLAAELALTTTDRLRSLTLIAPAGLAGDGTAPDMFELSRKETVERTFATDSMRQAALAASPSADTQERLARNKATVAKLARGPYLQDPTLGARLGALRTRTLIVWGAQDGIIPASYADAWRQALPHSTVEIVLRAAHLPHVESPAAAALIAKFVG